MSRAVTNQELLHTNKIVNEVAFAVLLADQLRKSLGFGDRASSWMLSLWLFCHVRCDARVRQRCRAVGLQRGGSAGQILRGGECRMG